MVADGGRGGRAGGLAGGGGLENDVEDWSGGSVTVQAGCSSSGRRGRVGASPVEAQKPSGLAGTSQIQPAIRPPPPIGSPLAHGIDGKWILGLGRGNTVQFAGG